MARIRSLKPEAFQSESLARVSVLAERTFFGLSTQVDDMGRIADKPAVINGALWPMRPEHTTADMETELADLAAEGLICRYVGCDGKRYLHLVTFFLHQRVDRPSKSRLPRCHDHRGEDDYCGRHQGECSSREGSPQPPEDSPDPREPSPSPREDASSPHRALDAGSRTVDRGSRTVDQKKASPSSPRKRGTRIPDDFAVTAGMVEWARRECPHVDGRVETENFIDYWRAKSGKDATKLDWVATWRTWMRNAEQRAPRAPNRRDGPARSTTDDRVAQAQALKAELSGDPPPPNTIRGDLE